MEPWSLLHRVGFRNLLRLAGEGVGQISRLSS